MTDIVGTPDSDVLQGSGGADRIYGRGRSDHLIGDNGDDILKGDTGRDYLYGGYGDDQCFGGAGGDYLFGGEGEDQCFGGSGDDHLYGMEDWDFLHGGTGNDWLEGGHGVDTLTGGAGMDTFRFSWVTSQTGWDVITDLAAGDVIKLDGFDLRSNVSMLAILPVNDDILIRHSVLVNGEWITHDLALILNADVLTVVQSLDYSGSDIWP